MESVSVEIKLWYESAGTKITWEGLSTQVIFLIESWVMRKMYVLPRRRKLAEQVQRA